MLLLAFVATWLAGRVSLGHWPRPSLDDPKGIGGLVDIPYHLTAFLLIAGLPAFGAGVFGLLFRAYHDEAQRRNLLLVSAGSVACMILAVVVLRWDPLGVVAWYAD